MVREEGPSLLHMNKSQEEAATTSNTLLLVNLESSFTWVTWLRRCHRLANQYLKLSGLKCLPPRMAAAAAALTLDLFIGR